MLLGALKVVSAELEKRFTVRFMNTRKDLLKYIRKNENPALVEPIAKYKNKPGQPNRVPSVDSNEDDNDSSVKDKKYAIESNAVVAIALPGLPPVVKN